RKTLHSDVCTADTACQRLCAPVPSSSPAKLSTAREKPAKPLLFRDVPAANRILRLTMLCLTVRQPWAALILANRKRIEWRSWPAPSSLIGQRLMIHAALTVEPDAARVLRRHRLPLITGCVIGSVRVVGVRWSRRWECWAWLLDDPVALKKPVPATGRLRLWEWAR